MMSDQGCFATIVVSIILLIALFGGTPDIADAIIFALTR